MKERPILFSAPMVRAILAGHKSQTRRIVKPIGNDGGFVIEERKDGSFWPFRSDDGESGFHTVKRNGSEYLDDTPHACPYGQTGDRLWVRESWRYTASTLEESRAITEDITSGIAVDWRATYIDNCMKQLGFSREDAEMAEDFETWRPSIHMPRWASRILLEVTGVRVEQLQVISEADALAEGIVPWYDGLEVANYALGPGDTSGAFGGPGAWRHEDTAVLAYKRLWDHINGSGSWETNQWVWVVEFMRVEL